MQKRPYEDPSDRPAISHGHQQFLQAEQQELQRYRKAQQEQQQQFRQEASRTPVRRGKAGVTPFSRGSQFDETPVRPLDLYDNSAWWSKNDLPSSEGYSTEDSLKYILPTLELIHETACELHEQRLTDNVRKKNRRYLTPSFHGATPTSAQVLSNYITTKLNDDEERRSFEKQWYKTY